MSPSPHRSSNTDSPSLVSVLVAAFNHGPFIIECLESIAASDYDALELRVLDDGSYDDTYELAREWARKNRDRFLGVDVSTQPNAGVTETLNRLIAGASGEFLAFVASDDALLPSGIRARVRTLHADPGKLAVFGNAYLIDRDSQVISSDAMETARLNKAALASEKLLPGELILRWYAPGPGFLARRSAFNTTTGVGLYEPSLAMEDRDFYLRLLSRRALAYLDDPVAMYRVQDSTSAHRATRAAVIAEQLGGVEAARARDFSWPESTYLRLTSRLSISRAGRGGNAKNPDMLHLMLHGLVRAALLAHSCRIFFESRSRHTRRRRANAILRTTANE